MATNFVDREKITVLAVLKPRRPPFVGPSVEVVVVVPWLAGSPVLRHRPEDHSSVEAVPPAKAVGLGVAPRKISLVGVALWREWRSPVEVGGSTVLVMEVGLRHVLLVEVGLWCSPVSVLSVVVGRVVVVHDVWIAKISVLACERLGAQLAALMAPITRLAYLSAVAERLDQWCPHISASRATPMQVLIDLVARIGSILNISPLVVVVVEASLMAGKILLWSPH